MATKIIILIILVIKVWKILEILQDPFLGGFLFLRKHVLNAYAVSWYIFSRVKLIDYRIWFQHFQLWKRFFFAFINFYFLKRSPKILFPGLYQTLTSGFFLKEKAGWFLEIISNLKGILTVVLLQYEYKNYLRVIIGLKRGYEIKGIMFDF